MGRPLLLTPDTAARIIEAVKVGAPKALAAKAVGISQSCLLKWLARGRKASSGIYFQFFHDIKKAEAAAAVRNVGIIYDAATKTWQAAAWWLERTLPEYYSADRDLLAEIKREWRKRKRGQALP